MKAEDIEAAVEAQEWAHGDPTRLACLLTPEALRALLEAQPREWDAETIKDAPPCLSWWVWHSIRGWEFQSWLGGKTEAVTVKEHISNCLRDGYYTHAVAVMKPPARPSSPQGEA